MFALLSFAGISLTRRNRRRTVLTMLAVACATIVFCISDGAPLHHRSYRRQDADSLAAPGGDEQVGDALRTSRIVLTQNRSDARCRRGKSDDLVRRRLRFSQASVLERRRRSRNPGPDVARGRLRSGRGLRLQGIPRRRDRRPRDHASLSLEGRTKRDPRKSDLPGSADVSGSSAATAAPPTRASSCSGATISRRRCTTRRGST